MESTTQLKGSCDLCGEALTDGDTVVQVVEDRHPTYDREIVLKTYHEHCSQSSETVTHDCPHCGCLFHLALLRKGDNCQNTDRMVACPFCVRLFDCDLAS